MREGYQGGGAPFPDPRFSYYSPTTGQGRGATYHTPAPPPPPPPAIAVARQIARSRAAPARRAPMPPPRPTDTGPLHDRPPWQEPYFHDRPPVTGDHYPDGVTDPQVPYRGFGKIIPPESLEPSGGKVPPRGFSDPQLPPPEPEYLQPEGAGTFLRNLPGRVTRMLPGGRLIEMGRRILSPDPLQPATGVEAPRTLGRSPSGPGPTIHAGPPPSHVTDLGTWENEGGAPGSTFQPSWSRDANPTDPDVQNMMNEGGRWRGGRASYADGGGPYDPGGSVGDWEGLDASNMSDDDFARGLEGEMRDAKPEDLGWISHLPTNFNFDQPARTRMQPMRGIDPGMRAEAPGGGGGSTNPNFGVTSLMGGNPITTANVGNIFGHYQPTTGIAGRGQWVQDSIPSNATAQVAGTHPAIAMRRRLSGHPAHTRAPPRAGPPDMSHHYDPLAGQPTGIPYGPPDMSGHYDPLAGQPTGITYGNPHGDDPPDVMSPEAVYNATRRYQGGGGVMGSSPYPNSAEQAKGLGSFASTKQSAGFGDLFGRQGFQLGGGSSNDQNDINAAISRAVQSMGSGHGANLPTAQPYKPPSGDQPGSPGEIAKHLQSMADNLTKKPTQTTSGSTTPSSSGIHPLVDTSSQAAPAPAPTQTSQGPAQVSVVNQNTDVADASLSGAGMDMGGGDVADAWRGGRTWRR